MAQKIRKDLKKIFEAGDKLTVSSFIDLIESLVSTQEDSKISGSLMPSKGNTFNLGSPEFPWKEVFVSKDSIKLIDTTTGETETLSKTDVEELKAIEAKRKSTDGIPLKKVRGFTSASTFIDLEASNQQAGDRIDIKVANTFEAASFSTARTSIGPKETVPLELTGSLKVRPSHTDPHEFLGKYQFKGNPENFGVAGKGVELLNDVGFKYSGSKDQVEFKPEGGVSFTGGNVVIEDAITSQPGVISQSISIGTFNTPSIAEYIGVEGNKRISIAPGVKVSVNPGSRLIIKPQQPNILANSTTGDITLTSTDGGDISFNVGSFGTNPTYIGYNIEIPAGNSAGWYGPIHIGKKFSSTTAGAPSTLSVTNLGKLRIKEDARLRIKDFNE
jgi:hypothetical protein